MALQLLGTLERRRGALCPFAFLLTMEKLQLYSPRRLCYNSLVLGVSRCTGQEISACREASLGRSKLGRSKLGRNGDCSGTSAPIRLKKEDWKEKRFKSFDYQTSMMLDYLANMNLSTNDEEIIQELGKVVTGFEIEYWNDSKIEDFYEAFSKMVTQLNNYQVQDNVGADEIKVTISAGNEEEKITQFNKGELSGTSQLMFNKIKSTIDNFGESLSYDEKMQVLAKIFSEIM